MVDKHGRQTHGLLHSHDFTPFDYCTKCKKPKFDHEGFLTHPSKYDLYEDQFVILDHEFSSAANTKEIAIKKRRIILAITGTITLAIAPIVNVLKLSF